MWIAQHPCGTWCAYKEKPTEKLGGWSGDIYSKLSLSLYLISWRQSLQELSEAEYQNRFRNKEVL